MQSAIGRMVTCNQQLRMSFVSTSHVELKRLLRPYRGIAEREKAMTLFQQT